MQRQPEETTEAIVGRVRVQDGFAITYLRKNDRRLPPGTSITFSLREWKGELLPQKGQIVLLEEIEKFAKGWRARSAYPMILSQKPEGGRE